MHDFAPILSWYFPELQAKHPVAPALDIYVPLIQLSHRFIRDTDADDLPARQSIHSLRPLYPCCLPGTHGKQNALPTVFCAKPEGHLRQVTIPDAATASENNPNPHLTQDSLEEAPRIEDPYIPVPHEKHAASFTFPAAALHLPFGQPLHGIDVAEDEEAANPKSSLNRPATHFLQPVISLTAAFPSPKVPLTHATQREYGLFGKPW